jgi:hypothetical protein
MLTYGFIIEFSLAPVFPAFIIVDHSHDTIPGLVDAFLDVDYMYRRPPNGGTLTIQRYVVSTNVPGSKTNLPLSFSWPLSYQLHHIVLHAFRLKHFHKMPSCKPGCAIVIASPTLIVPGRRERCAAPRAGVFLFKKGQLLFIFLLFSRMY